METKYKIGKKVVVNLDSGITDAEVFGIVESNSGGKPSYSLKVKGSFIFVEEDRIISMAHE